MDRNEIDARLYKLRADVPDMLAESQDEDDFWPVFAGEANLLAGAAASAEEGRYVRHQLNRILQQAGVSVRM